jgi:hypothetical protein
MVDNLEFVYSPEVKRNEGTETGMRINIDMWLRPLEQEINEKNIIVGVIYLSYGNPRIELLGADADLYARFKDRMKSFEV